MGTGTAWAFVKVPTSFLGEVTVGTSQPGLWNDAFLRPQTSAYIRKHRPAYLLGFHGNTPPPPLPHAGAGLVKARAARSLVWDGPNPMLSTRSPTVRFGEGVAFAGLCYCTVPECLGKWGGEGGGGVTMRAPCVCRMARRGVRQKGQVGYRRF